MDMVQGTEQHGHSDTANLEKKQGHDATRYKNHLHYILILKVLKINIISI